MQHCDAHLSILGTLDGSIYSPPHRILVLQVDGLKLQLEGTFVALKSHIMFYSGSGRE